MFLGKLFSKDVAVIFLNLEILMRPFCSNTTSVCELISTEKRTILVRVMNTHVILHIPPENKIDVLGNAFNSALYLTRFLKSVLWLRKIDPKLPVRPSPTPCPLGNKSVLHEIESSSWRSGKEFVVLFHLLQNITKDCWFLGGRECKRIKCSFPFSGR